VEKPINDKIIAEIEHGYSEIQEYRDQILSVLPMDASILIDHILIMDQFVESQADLDAMFMGWDLKMQHFLEYCILYNDHFDSEYKANVFCSKYGLEQLYNLERGIVTEETIVIGNASDTTANDTSMMGNMSMGNDTLS